MLVTLTCHGDNLAVCRWQFVPELVTLTCHGDNLAVCWWQFRWALVILSSDVGDCSHFCPVPRSHFRVLVTVSSGVDDAIFKNW